MVPVRDGLRPVEAQLKRYLSKVAERISFSSAILFGSRARNDHWESSDIDLLVVSPAFAPMTRGTPIDLLLLDWEGIPSLEPFGFTPEEVCDPQGLLLWDALDHGRVLVDDGTWRKARRQFQELIQSGALIATSGGWLERLDV